MKDSMIVVYSALIAVGVGALAFSILMSSSVMSFVGLGLLFWGLILTYVRTEDYVKRILLDTMVSSQMAVLNEIVQGLECEGSAVYLPAEYLSDPKANKVYIAKKKGAKLPTPQETQQLDPSFSMSFIEGSEAIFLTPSGAELTKLFEKRLRKNFSDVNLKYLQYNLPKLFVKDLEIAQNFEMESGYNKIHVKIDNSALNSHNSSALKQSNTGFILDSALGSSIACALAKATHSLIVIENYQASKSGKDIVIDFSIVRESVQGDGPEVVSA